MPSFDLLFIAFLALYLLPLLFGLWLERLNRIHLRAQQGKVPEGFEKFIDARILEKTAAYAQESSRFGSFQLLFSELYLLGLILFGFFPFLDEHLSRFALSPLPAGLLFFIIPGVIDTLLELPFDYYETFVLEKKYGFNRSTRSVWITDHLKNGLVMLVLVSLVLFLLLGLIQAAPGSWWIWGFLLLSALQLILVVLYPVVIAPWFNKFEPLRDEGLTEKIKNLMAKAGVRLKGLFKMDAGKRSSHTNAYFTGLGKTKRVVLFDTLLERHTPEELLGILAHEIGHYRKRHILKQFLFFEGATLIGLYLASRLLNWEALYHSFGFTLPKTYVGLFLLGLLGQKIGFFLIPLSMALSRRYERQADDYALSLLNTAEPLIGAFKRLAADNLINLNPHPFYVWFNYSHPPLTARIRRLQGP
ncbi:MAG: M48 family metallopeptidase [Deltaproteobacteria bacterium]|nr:M48 family metallopeptidase [Deltaproteobacteria bacterium]